MGDVKAGLAILKEKISDVADHAVTHGEQIIKSKRQKDNEAIDDLSATFPHTERDPETETARNCSQFKSALESTIDMKFAEIMLGKANDEKFLTYVDAQIMTAAVRNVFRNALGFTPPEVDASCSLSEAILAPSSEERQHLIKAAVGVGGGAAGIGMILTGIGAALGWGAGVIASVTAWFFGVSLAGPVGWTVGGVSLAAVAAYFATTSNKHTDTERFLSALKAANNRAVDAIWEEHEEALMVAADRGSPS
jgi:hypothetical protein